MAEDTQEPKNQSSGSAAKEQPAKNGAGRTSPSYFINTAPEMDALERAAADGKHGRYYQNNEQGQSRYHRAPGATHSVLLELSATETLAGYTTQTLEQFTQQQDADAALAFLYIAHVLAPPMGKPVGDYAGGMVAFDDVIAKIGWDPRSTAERRDMHRRIYQYILFGERAQVIGQRRGKYKDPHSGEVQNTVIRSSIWRIHKTEAPEQGSLFPTDEVPVSVEIVMSHDWTKMLTSPQTAQYLPLGEKLGAIPGNKPSGAWARVIGLSLASFWRRLPREALDGSVKPTRRELVERYPPKTGPVGEVLGGINPRRAVEYWCDALGILVEAGFVADHGDAQISYKEMRQRLPRVGWGDEWLDELVDLRPGPLLLPSIQGRISALPEAPAPKRRGRPRKKAE